LLTSATTTGDGRAASGHLLGVLPFEAVAALQQRLIYECGNERRPRAAILLTEHEPIVTVGRQGSRLHLRADDAELARRGLEVRFVKRGGGAIVHAPGQLAAYAIVPLAYFGLTVGRLIETWQTALGQTAADVGFTPVAKPGRLGLWGRGGQTAFIGAAVKQNVAHFGAYLNVAPAERLIHLATGDPHDGAEPTTLAAEMRRPVRMPTVRRALLDRLSTALGCEGYHTHTGHPYLPHYLKSAEPA
jgi:lipoate-protein ligase B